MQQETVDTVTSLLGNKIYIYIIQRDNKTRLATHNHPQILFFFY